MRILPQREREIHPRIPPQRERERRRKLEKEKERVGEGGGELS